MRPTRPDLARAALLVIDMQEYFRAIAHPLLATLPPVIERMRSLSVPVLWTRHGHEDPAQDAGMLFEWWNDHILVGSPGWEILSEVGPREGDEVVEKMRYSAFHGTDLEDRLHALGVTEVVISGVMTNLCCETTARDAFVRDFRVFFLTDGTATAEPALHRASLANLAYGFATLLSCGEVLDAVSTRPGPS